MSKLNSSNLSSDTSRLKQEALEWQVTLWSGEVTAEQYRAFEVWQQSSDLHQQTWAEIEGLQQRLHAVPGSAFSLIKDQPDSLKRRRLIQLLSVAAITGITVPAARKSEAWQMLAADYRTYAGQQRELVLADGSKLMMNTATALDIDYSASSRKLILRQGEIYVTTAPDVTRARPLLVETEHGVAEALGTKFNVRLKPHATTVSVHDGAVRLSSENGFHALTLASGMQATLSENAVTRATPVGNESAWIDGQLVAEQMRLGSFLDELARYRAGIIRYDQRVADMLVSGVFPLPDTDRILQSLLQALPLHIHSFSRYLITVHAA